MTHRPFRFFRVLFGCALLLATTLAHADTLDTIKKNGVVRIGVFMDYPPFGSIGPDMKPQGYDIEMGEYLARAITLKVKAEFVPITGENRMAYLAPPTRPTCCCRSDRRRNTRKSSTFPNLTRRTTSRRSGRSRSP